MRHVCKHSVLSVMRACRMGQLSSFNACMAQSTPASTKALSRGAAAVKESENSLDRLYEAVREQQPHEGCALSPQQVEHICSVIGEGCCCCTARTAQSVAPGVRSLLCSTSFAENIKLEDLGLNPALGQVRQHVLLRSPVTAVGSVAAASNLHHGLHHV